MNKNNYCVIMAGGVGSRFWPISRTQKPKQFLDILGTGKSLLQQTYSRFVRVCPSENIYIVTNEIYAKQVAEQLPEISTDQILAEPARRNTAPCIAYSNLKIKSKNPDANIAVAPSDHLILDETKFVEVIEKSFEFVSQNESLLTLGINPTRPETGYGYIQIDDTKPDNFNFINKVKSFTEKPNRETAEKFLESGEFVWNSGIFIWSLKSINKAFDKFLPDLAKLFSNIDSVSNIKKESEFVKNAYAECENISIDNGIMEYAENVFVYPTNFGWSDLGTWDSLYENSDKDKNNNASNFNNVLTYNTKNTLINIPKNKLVVVDGLDGYLIAESDNILLITKRDNESKIREFVKDVEEKKGEEFV
ncbi:MAG: mannose-1-phosphate guanylyltransferase [Bacteroidales bacterium]|nr:mannose-1-phosphate guanylyltransferase [Bacteroidales bacterium]